MSIKVDLKIFAFILLFFFCGQSDIYLILLGFATIHELGHLIMRTSFRIETADYKNYANGFKYFL